MPDTQPDIAAAIEWAIDAAASNNSYTELGRSILALNEQLEKARADARHLAQCDPRPNGNLLCPECAAIRQRQGGE